ncbi:flagellar hook-length control protein FliK [[Clostridium] colinum]|uniref:flagellar hook-length control protein FliK n=1 Tax=[Clostridium] colinum TaxID=36835 RepID=UPI002024B835|nr:flagellar hook-length control protein FliK [[Clostridium] colinum]
MNINNQNILNNTLYNNLIKNMDISNENLVTETLENINTNILNNKINETSFSISDEELKILLSSINQPINKETLNQIKALIQNGLPVNKENVQNMIRAMKIFKEYPLEKSLFLIKNNITPTQNMCKQLDNYISKDISINKQIENILSDIENIDNNQDILKNIFNGTKIEGYIKENNNILKDIKLQLCNDILKNTNFNKINKYLEDIVNLNKNNSNIKPSIDKTILLNEILDDILPESLMFQPSKLENLKQMLNFDNVYLPTFNNKNLTNIFDNPLSKENLNKLQNDIFNIIKSDNKQISKIKDLFDNIENTKNKIKHFNFENSSTEDLNDFFKDLDTISKNIKENMPNITENKNDNILKNLENLNKNLEFMSNIKDSIFLQIPLNINNFSTTAELYVFSDKKHKKNKNKTDSGSALISLNLAYLGKLEVYINKHSKDINCQFRLEKEYSKNMIRDNISLLELYLKEKNLQLKEVSFHNLDESFTLITNNINNVNNTKNNNIKISNFNAKA